MWMGRVSWEERVSSDVARRMEKSAPKGRESLAHFKTRLRKTALSTKPSVVERMILAMRGRAQAIWEAGGGDIKRD